MEYFYKNSLKASIVVVWIYCVVVRTHGRNGIHDYKIDVKMRMRRDCIKR